MPTTHTPQGVNDRIRTLLREAGITQTDLARTLGCDQSQVSKRLLGRIDWRLSELAQVARLLNVKLDAIVAMDVR